jgi:hypothetical protein
MLQTRDVAVAVAVLVAVEVVVPVVVAVAVPFTRARAKRHLSLQTTHPSEPTGSGNSSGCWRCSSPNTTSSMSDYVSARVKQLREATALMNEKQRLEEVKRKECSLRQRQPHDKILSRIADSYSCR